MEIVKKRGFAALSPEERAAAGRKGGAATAKAGTGYRFTPEAAREAGRKGGFAPRGRVRKTKVHRALIAIVTAQALRYLDLVAEMRAQYGYSEEETAQALEQFERSKELVAGSGGTYRFVAEPS